MTQTEYENPDRPMGRAPIGSVIIERFHVWESEIVQAGERVKVRTYDLNLWGAFGYSYRTIPGSKTLYTMDNFGNAKSPSCFREP